MKTQKKPSQHKIKSAYIKVIKEMVKDEALSSFFAKQDLFKSYGNFKSIFYSYVTKQVSLKKLKALYEATRELKEIKERYYYSEHYKEAFSEQQIDDFVMRLDNLTSDNFDELKDEMFDDLELEEM